jgi:hypothetical protein
MSDSDSDNSSSNEAEAQPNASAEKTRLPTVEDTLANDESVKFFDTASELSYPDSSSSSFSTSFNSESEESVFQIDYSDSDSSSSPEIDLNEKAIKRKSSDLDDSLIPSAKRTEIPLEFLGDPKLTNGCFKIEPEENNNDPV